MAAAEARTEQRPHENLGGGTQGMLNSEVTQGAPSAMQEPPGAGVGRLCSTSGEALNDSS